MSQKAIKFYEFADFRLDLAQKALLRSGKSVPLTPKVFDTLEILLESNGRLLEKEELMQEIWKDTIVEESNLTSNIKMLRKALGDDAARPRYIETVPRRGYRFVAEVRAGIAEEPVQYGGTRSISPPVAEDPINSPGLRRFLLPAAALLCIGVIAGGFWYARSGKFGDGAPILLAEFSSENISTDGKVFHAVISPDGKNVVYTRGLGSDKQSVWLRQLESSNNVQIIPPSDDRYAGFAFSPDGNFLYFARQPEIADARNDIYRVSIFGGIPSKIVSETQGWISVSSDGSRISFIRCPYRDDEYCSLYVAAADGKNPKKLLSRPGPIRVVANRISPDGRTIAFAFGQSRTGANEFRLAEVDIESGAEREITPQTFFNIRQLAWLPDGSGLLFTALKVPDKDYRIWQVSTDTGEVSQLTKDTESYSGLSLDRDARVLVSTRLKADFRLKIYHSDIPAQPPRVLGDASTVAFSPNGKVIFSSALTGNHEVWSINADGSEQRQLTNDAADDLLGVVSPDNNFIFFESNRSGESQVWRMKADGSNQVQITHRDGGFPMRVSPDGKWLYYKSALQRKLMRVPTDGGEEEPVLDKPIFYPAVSPDASRVAFAEKQSERMVLTIVSLADKRPVKTYDIPIDKTGYVQCAWSPDGKRIFCVIQDSRSENYAIWQQPLDGQMARKIVDLGADEIRETTAFAVSPDGRSFAVIQGGWKHDAVLLRGLK